jgi:excisionase family DNA binding protein
MSVVSDSGRLLTVKEAAARLSMGQATLYALLAAGKIDSVKIGGSRRFTPEAIQAFIDNHTVPARETQTA